jgi:hypothetical protein
VWDDAWIAEIDGVEEKLERRICGARTLTGSPCVLTPSHENGRCRFHGGFDLTGAPAGNRNAVIHGLYSRAIQTCGKQCPMWKSCPCAGADVAEMDAKERPRCPYETAQYNTALTDTMANLKTATTPDPMRRHLAHQIALLQVMMTRAASAMAQEPMVDTDANGETGRAGAARLSACLQSYLRISSEYRRYLAIANIKVADPMERSRQEDPEVLEFDLDCPNDEIVREHGRRASHDTSLLPEDQAAVDAPTTLATPQAMRHLGRAMWAGYSHDTEQMRSSLRDACSLDADCVEAIMDPESVYRNSSYENMLLRMWRDEDAKARAYVDEFEQIRLMEKAG